MKTVPGEVKFTDEGLGKSRPMLLRDEICGVVEGEDVRIGRGKEGRSFDNDDVFSGDKFFKMLNDCCLYVFSLSGCS